MTSIERTISVTWRHRVYFTRGVFGAQSDLLRQVLALDRSNAVAKVLVVVDEMLAQSQPSLLQDTSATNRGSVSMAIMRCGLS